MFIFGICGDYLHTWVKFDVSLRDFSLVGVAIKGKIVVKFTVVDNGGLDRVVIWVESGGEPVIGAVTFLGDLGAMCLAIYGVYKAFNERIEGAFAPLTSAFSKVVAVTSIVSVPLQIANHALTGAYKE